MQRKAEYFEYFQIHSLHFDFKWCSKSTSDPFINYRGKKTDGHKAKFKRFSLFRGCKVNILRKKMELIFPYNGLAILKISS